MTDKLREEIETMLQRYEKALGCTAFGKGFPSIARMDFLTCVEREIARARAEALEEAAKVADGHVWAADCIDRASDVEWGGSEAAKEIAAAIRAQSKRDDGQG